MAAPNLHYLPTRPDMASGGEAPRVRMLHLAEGVLVALRRRPAGEVLTELVNVARAAALPPYAVAAALVRVTSGECPEEANDPATAVVREVWGSLLLETQRPPPP